MDTRAILTLVSGVTVCAAFLFTVLAPAFGVIVPQTTTTFVFGAFAALVGGGGAASLIQVGQRYGLTAQAIGKLDGPK
jgi:hypothetical protein